MCIEYFWLVEGFFNKMDDCLIYGDCREVCECCVKSWYVFGEFIVYVFFVVVIDYLVQNQLRGICIYSVCYNVDSWVNLKKM